MLSKNDLSLSFSVACGCHFFMLLSVRSVLIAFTVVLCSGFTQIGKVSLEVI